MSLSTSLMATWELFGLVASSSSTLSSLVRPMTFSCSSVLSSFHAFISCRYFCTIRYEPLMYGELDGAEMRTAFSASLFSGFSVPSTNPSKSRLSKNLNPWVSSTTVATLSSRSITIRASSQHISTLAARRCRMRSPGVDGAECLAPRISRNSCSCSGMGAEVMSGHSRAPIPITP